MRRTNIFTCLVLTCTLFACKKNTDSPPITKTLQLPAGSDAVITAGNEFAFKFFNATLQTDPAPNNKLISPLSIYTALSMLYNGAGTATKDSIAKALQLQGISIDDLNALNKALIEQMPGEDNKVAMNIANSIWYNKAVPQPLPAFLNTMTTDYKAAIQSLDFSAPSAVNSINSWVSDKTRAKIPKIIDAISPMEVLFLINAIYFNGSWQKSFDPKQTRTGNFTLSSGSSVSVPFMSKYMTVRMAHDASFSLLELPYGGGKSYDMYLLLPDDRQQSLTDFAASVNEVDLASALSKLDSVSINVSLPKWEYSYSIDDMKPQLSRLGMGIAFGNNADLSGMYPVAPGDLQVSRAVHKTYIKVSEEGTEAAAATVVGVQLTLSMPASITFNHPFLYVLREKQAGTILFIGVVNDPSK